ncbi:MAG: hypothetical protein IPN42_07090 [Methylococcaceae bacterium]|nr:hypothetical protein [Methylococcaceae bacterium]
MTEITAERDALKAEAAKKNAELEDLKKQIGDEKKASTALIEKHGKEKAAQQKVTDELHSHLDATNAKLREVIDKYNTLNQANKQLIDEHVKLNTTQQATSTELKVCSAKNLKMLTVSKEVIENYRKCQEKDWVDAVVDSEPLLQLNTVKFEKMLQDVEDRINREEYDEKTKQVAP